MPMLVQAVPVLWHGESKDLDQTGEGIRKFVAQIPKASTMTATTLPPSLLEPTPAYANC